ncbi:glycosyltransferase family 39 protein [Bacteroidota bacterium]
MTKKQIALVWGLLLSLSALLYYSQIKSPVKGRHAWAMADHFAITLNFIDNDFDFFHPETYCLNPQFAATNANQIEKEYWSFHPKKPEGITSIDPPIHHYIVALLMKLLDTSNPSIYRFYMLILSLIGLFYLFKLSYYFTTSFTIGIAVIIFVFFAPTFTFYAVGFLPSTAALALLFIAAYHMTKFYFEQKNKYLCYSLILMTLSALTRFPFIIYLIGLLFTYIITGFFKKKFCWKKLIAILSCLIVVFLYFVYNKFYLSKNFGSNFLSYPLPAKNFQQFIQSIWGAIYYESWRYFTLAHYLCLVIIGMLFNTNRKKYNYSLKNNLLFLYISIVTIGVFCYSTLMLRQFKAHDYYILDTFFPLLLFWILAFYKHLEPKHLKSIKKYLVVFSIIAFGLNRLVFKIGYDARPNSSIEITRINFQNSHNTLDSLLVNKNSKILLIDSYSPNLAFIGLKRKGFCVMKPSYKTIKRALNWDYDYIITQNFSYQENVLKNYPTFEKETEIYFSNDKFTIHRKK